VGYLFGKKDAAAWQRPLVLSVLLGGAGAAVAAEWGGGSKQCTK
jgi:hypothetical protein